MLSNYLKQYFKEKKITQEKIKEETGIERSKINLSLNGKRKLKAEELILIAIKFDLDLNKIKELDNL